MSKLKPALSREVARQLDVSIFKLRRREDLLAKQLGMVRVGELRQFANKEMEPRRESSFKQGMNWSDKELVWLWRVIDRAHDEQVGAWREAILAESPRVEPPFAAPGWRKGRRRGRVNGRINQEMLDRIIGV